MNKLKAFVFQNKNETAWMEQLSRGVVRGF